MQSFRKNTIIGRNEIYQRANLYDDIPEPRGFKMPGTAMREDFARMCAKESSSSMFRCSLAEPSTRATLRRNNEIFLTRENKNGNY